MVEERPIQPQAKEVDQARETARGQAEAKWREKIMYGATHRNMRAPEELAAYDKLEQELEDLKTAGGFSQEDVKRDYSARMKVVDSGYYDLLDGEWNDAIVSEMKAITDSDPEVNYFFRSQLISDLFDRDYEYPEQMTRVPSFLRLIGYLWGEDKRVDFASRLGGVIARKMRSMDQLVNVTNEARLPSELQQSLVFAYLAEHADHLGRPRTSVDDVRSVISQLNLDTDRFNTALAQYLQDDLRLLTSEEPSVNLGEDPDIGLITNSIEKYVQLGLPRAAESSYVQFVKKLIEERKTKSSNPQKWDDVLSQLQLTE